MDRGQAENDLFGTSEVDSLHFDVIMAGLLTDNADTYSAFSDYDSSYTEAYNNDLTYLDDLGNASTHRQNMYNPMYFISDYNAGYNTSTLAKYWRINTGITQGDTSSTVEVNLALALQANAQVENVGFTIVWGKGHTTAERTDDSTTNFIAWVNEIVK